MDPNEQQDRIWDPASQSLAEALNLSLKILKVIMGLLLILFLSSGIFTVNENEQAIVLVLGKVKTEGAAPILKPGLHWTWPYPLSEVIKIPVTQQSIEIKDFWYYHDPEQKHEIVPPGLDPTKDGYTLTGDKNLVHSKWQLRYRITDPYLYLTGSKESDEFIAGVYLEEKRDDLIHDIACSCIIEATARFTVEKAIKKKDNLRLEVQSKIEKKIDDLNIGIDIDGVELVDIIPPRQVKDAFESVLLAEQEAHREVKSAEKYRTQILTQAGSDAESIEREAGDYSLNVEKRAKSTAEKFQKLVEQYRQNPDIFRERHYQQVIEQIFSGLKEVFLLRDVPRQLRIHLNSDPQLYRFKPSKED